MLTSSQLVGASWALAFVLTVAAVLAVAYLWLDEPPANDTSAEEAELREAVSTASAAPDRLEAAIEAARKAGVNDALVWTANSALMAAWRARRAAEEKATIEAGAGELPGCMAAAADTVSAAHRAGDVERQAMRLQGSSHRRRT